METRQHKILLVDDVDFFLDLEKDFLKRTPARILTARNGREALEQVRTHHPDLVFMDVNMPVMDGLACCRSLKSDPQYADTPIVMVFAPTQEVDDRACLAAGCDAVMSKPVDRRTFLELGRRFLFAVDRREMRIACQMTVDFQTPDRRDRGMGLDISEHGVYVGYRREIREDERIKLGFFLPGVSPERLEVSGRVAWVNQGFPRPNLSLPQGFGVEFRVISSEASRVLGAYVEKFAPAAN